MVIESVSGNVVLFCCFQQRLIILALNNRQKENAEVSSVGQPSWTSAWCLGYLLNDYLMTIAHVAK